MQFQQHSVSITVVICLIQCLFKISLLTSVIFFFLRTIIHLKNSRKQIFAFLQNDIPLYYIYRPSLHVVGKSCKLLLNLEYWNEKVYFYCRKFIDKFVELPVFRLCTLLKVVEENNKISTLYLLKTAG